MSAATTQRLQTIEWGVATRPMPGEAVSGDLHGVAPWRDGVIAAVVDGLGHGEEATAAARLAINVIEAHAGEDLVAMVGHCHRALQQTRGVVMTILAFSPREGTVTALGIGNVETVLVRENPHGAPKQESILLRGGVVGYQLPALLPSVLPIAPGDVVVFATDGVREDFSDLITPAASPQPLAEKIMALKYRGTDDGLVLACKYLGTA